jgi:hypothetical protein
MRVIVATTKTQGQRPGDYFWAVEGELVLVPTLECCEPARCGCGRGFAGLASHRACTTAEVVERGDLTPTLLADLMEEDWIRQGVEVDALLRAAIEEDVAFVTSALDGLALGQVLERAGDLVTVRRSAEEAS